MASTTTGTIAAISASASVLGELKFSRRLENGHILFTCENSMVKEEAVYTSIVGNIIVAYRAHLLLSKVQTALTEPSQMQR